MFKRKTSRTHHEAPAGTPMPVELASSPVPALEPTPLVRETQPSPYQVLQLQRMIGNRAVQRFLNITQTPTASEVSAEVDKLVEDAKSVKTNKYNEETGSAKEVLVNRIAQVRERIAKLDDAGVRAELYQKLNQTVPFYYQIQNADILYRSKTAGYRTCNVSALAMNLEGLGRTSADFSGDRRLLTAIAEEFEGRIAKSEYYDAFESLNQLRLPDFLQLVVIYVVSTTEGKIGSSRVAGEGYDIESLLAMAQQNPKEFSQAIQSARNTAKDLITNSKTFDAFTQLFGVSTLSYEVDKEDKASLADYKARVTEIVQTETGNGRMIVGHMINPVTGHFVRVDSVNSEGIVIDDPGGWRKKNRFLTWKEAKEKRICYRYFTLEKNKDAKAGTTQTQSAVSMSLPTLKSLDMASRGTPPTTSQSPAQTESPAQEESANPHYDFGVFGSIDLDLANLGSGMNVMFNNLSHGENEEFDVPWAKGKRNFYQKAARANQRISQRPPHPAWPYLAGLKELWEAGKARDFANWVAFYQQATMQLPLSEVDGILGGATTKAMKQSHPDSFIRQDPPQISAAQPAPKSLPTSSLASPVPLPSAMISPATPSPASVMNGIAPLTKGKIMAAIRFNERQNLTPAELNSLKGILGVTSDPDSGISPVLVTALATFQATYPDLGTPDGRLGSHTLVALGKSHFEQMDEGLKARVSIAQRHQRMEKLDVSAKVVSRIETYDPLITSISAEMGIDPNLVRGIIAAESGGKADSGAKGKYSYKGLMQAEKTVNQLDPATSIRQGIGKFMEYRKMGVDFARQYGVAREMTESEQIALTMVLYNAGPGSVKEAMKYAQKDGDATQWFSDPYFVRSLMHFGAYATSPLRQDQDLLKLQPPEIAEEFAQVSGRTLEDLQATYQDKDGNWNTSALISGFISTLEDIRAAMNKKPTEQTMDEYETLANGWLIKAARFKHANQREWYVQRVMNYKDFYELEAALQLPEIAAPQEEDAGADAP